MRNLLLISLLLTVCSVASATPNGSVAGKIQALKQQAVKLHKDLLQLEADLLYPAKTQVAIYVSKKLAKSVVLSQLELFIDDQRVASHIYSAEDNHALDLGGMQRLYLGNVRVGEHEFKVTAKGIDQTKAVITLQGNAGLYKSSEPLSINIGLSDTAGTTPPVLSVDRL